MKIRFFLMLLPFLSMAVLADIPQADPSFKSSVSAIPNSIKEQMQKYTWYPSCPIPLTNMRYLRLTYWGYDNKSHMGELVINRALTSDVIEIFKELYLHKFPIQQMKLMEAFKGDDNAALEANNTSAFNCRAITGHPGVFSQHSYGRALDINPLINPYVNKGKIMPASGEKFIDRNKPYPGKITQKSFIYYEFIKRGWIWGGDWQSLHDYQHFEKKDDKN